MIDYDPGTPLIFSHIPKTAGTSVRAVFESWYGAGLKPHYHGAGEQQMPPRYELDSAAEDGPFCIYGHFNRGRQFGIDDYYPDSKQIVTFLRDPWQRVLSLYFYAKKQNLSTKNPMLAGLSTIEDYVLNDSFGIDLFLPKHMNINNFESVLHDRFVAVGVVEDLEQSLRHIGNKLEFGYQPGAVQHINVAERDEPIPEGMRDAFREQNELEYALYDYASGLAR